MKIAVIDADIVGKTKHRFPNLAVMKISAYHKSQGHEVELVDDYSLLTLFGIPQYDKIFLSKVFTDTPVEDWVFDLPNIEWGVQASFMTKLLNYQTR